MSEDYPIDHYYSIDGEEFEEGHILCTVEEASQIKEYLQAKVPEGVIVTVEPGGEYDEVVGDPITWEMVAASIWQGSGFNVEEVTDE